MVTAYTLDELELVAKQRCTENKVNKRDDVQGVINAMKRCCRVLQSKSDRDCFRHGGCGSISEQGDLTLALDDQKEVGRGPWEQGTSGRCRAEPRGFR